jgi:hypothetical protein
MVIRSDYIFEIDSQSLHTDMIDIETFLVEPGNVAAFENALKEFTDSWNNEPLVPALCPNEFITVGKAEVFTNLSPWLVIVLFVKKVIDSKPFQNEPPSKSNGEKSV